MPLRFIVAREEYTRGPSGSLSLDIYTVNSVQDLLPKLGWEAYPEDGSEFVYNMESLRDANGDGMDFYCIKELQPDGQLSEDLAAIFEGEAWLYCEDFAGAVVGPFADRIKAEEHREKLRARGDAGIGRIVSPEEATEKAKCAAVLKLTPEQDLQVIGPDQETMKGLQNEAFTQHPEQTFHASSDNPSFQNIPKPMYCGACDSVYNGIPKCPVCGATLIQGGRR